MTDDMHVTIREALPGDAEDFAELVLLSSLWLFPAIYGGSVRDLMRYLFRQRDNLFGFEHVCFAELDGKKAGVILGYDWRAKRGENLRTGYLLLKHMKGALAVKIPSLMKVNGVVGMVGEVEYYVSNIGVYPQYTVTLTAADNFGHEYSTSFSGDGGGENFFAVSVVSDQLIDWIEIRVSGENMQDLRQIRIGGIQMEDRVPVVPEPGALMLLGAGLIGAAFGLRRKN